MFATARLLEQRSVGHVKLRMERGGVAILREAGAAKVRVPRHSREAILINTSGGLAGGDAFEIEVALGSRARLTLTSQAAERVYRTLGPAATVTARLSAEAHAQLLWLPQETILFDGAALTREFSVRLAKGAVFLAVEPIVLGRKEMGESIGKVLLKDTWRIYRDGELAHADNLLFSGTAPASSATLNGATAFATIIYMSDAAETVVDRLREALGSHGGASAWNGKMVARVVAQDGFHLRKTLVSAISAIAGVQALPSISAL